MASTNAIMYRLNEETGEYRVIGGSDWDHCEGCEEIGLAGWRSEASRQRGWQEVQRKVEELYGG